MPAQIDDLDNDGVGDEFVFPVSLPWPKRVHASHAYGYNRATVTLESEAIGYRTYGGFCLDIPALPESPISVNSLAGCFGSRNPEHVGRDITSFGDTLGLGGLFLRAGDDVFRLMGVER